MLTHTNTKEIENSREPRKFIIDNTDCNTGRERRSKHYREEMSESQTACIGGAESIAWPPTSPDFTP
jgi:hypothetical protein